IYLIGANAERANCDQVRSAFKNSAGQLGRGSNANQIRIADRLDQLRLWQGLFMELEVRVAVCPKSLQRARMNSLEQNNFHFFFGERGFGHGSKTSGRLNS